MEASRGLCRRRRARALALLVAPLVGTAAAQGPEVDYELTVLPEERVVLVAARVHGLPSDADAFTLSWPQGYAFARLPEPLFEGDVAATADGVALPVERTDSHAWRIASEGVPVVELAWIVPVVHREHPVVVEANDAYEYPYLDADHGLLVTATLLGVPVQDEPVRAATVRFHLPEGWAVHAPWPEREPGVYVPGAGLQHDLVAVGAWEVRTIPVGDFEATVAVAPGQGDLLAVVAPPIERIVAHELEVFGRAPRERYLFLFGRSDIQGFAGSPKTGSMTLAVGRGARAVADRYVPHLVAHEFFHTWAASTARMADELRWLNEGVTDWYAYLVQTRVGLSDGEALAGTLGEKITAWGANPLRGEKGLVEAGGPAFFEGGDAYRLVYDGGLVVGAWLERALRTRHGIALDELMRSFLNDPERFAGPEPVGTLADFLGCVAELADQELARELGELVRSAAVPDPVALFGRVGVEVADHGPDAPRRYVVDPAPWVAR